MSSTDLGRHECNALCRPADHQHCDLVYCPATYAAESVAGAYWWGPHLWVTRVEPATEAPPLPAIPLPKQEHFGTGAVPGDSRAWLVWWLTPAEYRRQAQARKEARFQASLKRAGITEAEYEARRRRIDGGPHGR